MIPSTKGISKAETSTILLLSNFVSGKLCSKVSQIDESYSFAQTTSNPAFLKPRSRPPAPVNKDTNFINYLENLIIFASKNFAGLFGDLILMSFINKFVEASFSKL